MFTVLATIGTTAGIAIANLAIGFAIALLLGRGPRTLRERYGVRWRYRVDQFLARRSRVS